ncbi:MAG TPA: tRNA-specific adenosine deaminase [Cyanobacteria bacterium UBA11991]|nr:nucleoside deaminase [Cyanobacteriota bacterium]MDY6359133.1 nucleoside deaminase [Cyanobacteriota bacterium]MDY6363603.1 nucleoside deaminase [Cyanobacteriota bacterium]HCB10860.1 tRNA-specific adenosine deaminase [Cyanobacteria bacterium UBA11991]
MNTTQANIIANETIDETKVAQARKIILELQNNMPEYINNGFGPFIAAIYDKSGKLIAKSSNTVLKDNCSSCHAEVNTIRLAEQNLGTYDLSKFDLSLYVTAEPCIMCLGAIMWSGIKSVYYGVPSKDVERITGFDEGFKPHWFEEFKARGITVYGNIEPAAGEKELEYYMTSNKIVYKPQR